MMIPVGYMAKRVATKPDWLKNDLVKDIYSVSACVSDDFADYIQFWKHNGYWLFDSPKMIQDLAKEHQIDLEDCTMFYYEAYPYQFDEAKEEWEPFHPEPSFATNIQIPTQKALAGFDIVSFSTKNAAEHSYLSCNHMAEEIQVNPHCLLDSFAKAKDLLEQHIFENCEPGPSRIFAVYTLSHTQI